MIIVWIFFMVIGFVGVALGYVIGDFAGSSRVQEKLSAMEFERLFNLLKISSKERELVKIIQDFKLEKRLASCHLHALASSEKKLKAVEEMRDRLIDPVKAYLCEMTRSRGRKILAKEIAELEALISEAEAQKGGPK